MGDVYMKRCQGELLDEVEQSCLDGYGRVGRRGARFFAAYMVSRIRCRMGTWLQRKQQRLDHEKVASLLRGTEDPC